MKKTLIHTALISALALGTSQAHAGWFNNDNDGPWGWDNNSWPEWTLSTTTATRIPYATTTNESTTDGSSAAYATTNGTASLWHATCTTYALLRAEP